MGDSVTLLCGSKYRPRPVGHLWQLGVVAAVGVLLAGCCNASLCQMPDAPVPRPKLRRPASPPPLPPAMRSIEVVDEHVLEGTFLELGGAGEVTQGRVTVTLQTIDGRSCDHAPELVGLVGCMLDPLAGDLHALRLSIRNDMTHALRIDPLLLRFRLADGSPWPPSGVAALRSHWRKVSAGAVEHGRVVPASPKERYVEGAKFRLVHELGEAALAPLGRTRPLELSRALLPGETREGLLIVHVPASLSPGQPFQLGLYDVVVSTDRAGTTTTKVAFEFELRKRTFAFPVRFTRTEQVPADSVRPPGAGPRITAAATPAAETGGRGYSPSGPRETFDLSQSDALGRAIARLTEMVGAPTWLRMANGQILNGTVGGVQGTQLLLVPRTGPSESVDLLQAAELSLPRPPGPPNLPRPTGGGNP